MKKTIILFFCLFLFLFTASIVIFSNTVSAQCIYPNDAMSINTDTVLCTGMYNLSKGIIINANSITLDCNSAILVGVGHVNGIYVNNRSKVTIKNCNIKNYYYGIFIQSSNKIVLINNHISDNAQGIYLHNSSNNTITDSDASSNIGYGITLDSSTNNNFVTNNILSNSKRDGGIYLEKSDYNRITGNKMLNNAGYGILVSISDHNKIIGNTILDNKDRDAYIVNSNQNIISNNLFCKIYNNADTNTIVDNICNKIESENGVIGEHHYDKYPLVENRKDASNGKVVAFAGGDPGEEINVEMPVSAGTHAFHVRYVMCKHSNPLGVTIGNNPEVKLIENKDCHGGDEFIIAKIGTYTFGRDTTVEVKARSLSGSNCPNFPKTMCWFFLDYVKFVKEDQATTTTIKQMPNKIKVFITSTNQTVEVNFKEYVKNVLPNEWIPSWDMDALKAGAMAVKTYAWYQIINEKYPGKGYHVMDNTSDQVYRQDSSHPNTNRAVEETWNFVMTKDGSIFESQYYNGIPNSSVSEPRKMSQYGTQYLAEKNYDWRGILHYYYNPISITPLKAPSTTSDVPTTIKTPVKVNIPLLNIIFDFFNNFFKRN